MIWVAEGYLGLHHFCTWRTMITISSTSISSMQLFNCLLLSVTSLSDSGNIGDALTCLQRSKSATLIVKYISYLCFSFIQALFHYHISLWNWQTSLHFIILCISWHSSVDINVQYYAWNPRQHDQQDYNAFFTNWFYTVFFIPYISSSSLITNAWWTWTFRTSSTSLMLYHLKSTYTGIWSTLEL